MTRQEAIDLYFEGDRALFDEYLLCCQAQFPVDIHTGDTACARQEWPPLQHLAHSLKTVLQTLGRHDLALTAIALEEAALIGNAAEVRPLWQRLREALTHSANPG